MGENLVWPALLSEPTLICTSWITAWIPHFSEFCNKSSHVKKCTKMYVLEKHTVTKSTPFHTIVFLFFKNPHVLVQKWDGTDLQMKLCAIHLNWKSIHSPYKTKMTNQETKKPGISLYNWVHERRVWAGRWLLTHGQTICDYFWTRPGDSVWLLLKLKIAPFFSQWSTSSYNTYLNYGIRSHMIQWHVARMASKED